ncbi:S-adenosyl-L-methionine-dependent methyltransferase [Rostrohypoxylon terebratum]|nr:S-adenosyl-L-methionine-dependent methyltransferase [Rostrohypoxylon terebratum]
MMQSANDKHKQNSAGPQINSNPQLQDYSGGSTRHFGCWKCDTYRSFPPSEGLRSMEDKMAEALTLPPESQMLDAGCGVGHVALRMANKHGLRVEAIDIVDHHVATAQRNLRNVERVRLPQGAVRVRQMDYRHLKSFADESLDGIYTNRETFVHATDPKAVLAGFCRILRPVGHLAQFEYDYNILDTAPWDIAASMVQINRYSAMPTNAISHPGVFKEMLEEAGFENVIVRDYLDTIRPMTRVFFLAVVPYLFHSLVQNRALGISSLQWDHTGAESISTT